MEIKDIERLAKLARIELSDEEKAKFATEIEDILGYVDQIKEVKTAPIEPSLGEVYNVFREDDNPRMSGEYTEKILAEMPETKDGFLKVKKIL